MLGAGYHVREGKERPREKTRTCELQIILIFKRKTWYFTEEIECFSMLMTSMPLSLVIVYSRYALHISDNFYIVSIVFSLYTNQFLMQLILIVK